MRMYKLEVSGDSTRRNKLKRAVAWQCTGHFESTSHRIQEDERHRRNTVQYKIYYNVLGMWEVTLDSAVDVCMN